MNGKELDAVMALSFAFPRGSALLEEALGTGNDICRIADDIVRGTLKVPGQIVSELKATDYEGLHDIQNYCTNTGVRIMTRFDEDFPASLKELDCPPLVLYCMGDPGALSCEKSLAMVGARKADEYSVKTAERLSYELTREGYTIISGFANGIDTAAHRGALNAGGKTVAVLGCGAHYDYPRGKFELKKAIANSGAVISEYPPLEKPYPDYFLVRNRMIAGLSQGTLVVQANEISGSLNTAGHALEQGKEVFALPPADIFSDKYSGQKSLLIDGAVPVYSYKSITSVLENGRSY